MLASLALTILPVDASARPVDLAPPALDAAVTSTLHSPDGSAIAAPRTEQPLLAPPAPQSVGGVEQNWSPYAPSAFTYDTLDLTMHFDSVAIGALPNVAPTQTGNLTLVFNGTWNPAPATSSTRDWITLIAVLNGRASVRTLESNTTTRIAINSSQLPARFFFAMPSPVAFASPSSTAQVFATLPSGNTTRLNLTAASCGLNVASMPAAAAVASSSVWFNGTGNYTPGGYLSALQNITVVSPLNGLPAFEVAAGQVVQWTGPGSFPGARLFLLVNTSNNGNVGPRVTLWTRGSPESGLYLNLSAAPANLSRGGDVNLTGAVGARSLVASTNWSVNTTSVLAPNHPLENCTNLVRLQNGSWRLFCNFRAAGANNTTVDGVDSAYSPDGVTWAWEPGVRYQLCAGTVEIDQLSLQRLLDGRLRMYYTGRNPPACNNLPNTHLESATSADEGVTWSLEGQYFDVNATVVAPTVDGGLRFFIANGSGFMTFVVDAVTGWLDGLNITADMPRTVYLLSDGSYKMYFGTSAVYSAVSPNGVNWSAPSLEVANWSGDIEAGPLLDPGDGSLTLLLYSQTGGLFLARLGGNASSASVALSGRLSDGRSFGAATFNPNGGAFQGAVTVPANAPLGRYRLSATAWFGGPSLTGLVLNRPPLWTGPSAIAAQEDEALTVNLADWATDFDTADLLTITANSSYGNLSGSNLTLLYPEGVLADTVTGTLFDGFDSAPFRFDVNVTPFNDPPNLTLAASYTVVEDQLGDIDLTGAYADEETAFGLLVVTTDLPGAQVLAPLLRVTMPTSGTFAFRVDVTDGVNSVSAVADLIVSPVDDAPTLSLDPSYTFTEDQPGMIDLTGRFADEETAAAGLVLATNLTGATVNSPLITVDTTLPSSQDIWVSVSDGNHTATATTRVIVTPVDDAPVIAPLPRFTVAEDTPLTIDFAPYLNDEDTGLGGLSLTKDLAGATVSGLRLTVTLSEPRLWAFNIWVTDGTSTASREVLIDVTPVNDAPRWVTLPDFSMLAEGEIFRVDLAPYAADLDNASADLSFSVLSNYATVNGTVLELLYPAGVVSDVLTLRVSDGLLLDQRVVSVAVRPRNDNPVLVGNPPTEVAPGTNVTFAFTGTDRESPGSLSFALTTSAPWISLSPAGVITFSPPLLTQGRFTYTVVLGDGAGGFASQAFEVGVSNHAPHIGDFPRNATPNVPYSARIPVDDADGDLVTVTVTADVPGIIYNPATGLLSWYPNFTYPPGAGFNFVANLNVTATDGLLTSTLQTWIVVRDPPDDPPFITGSFDDIRGSVGEVYSVDLQGRASDIDDPPSNLTWRVVAELDPSVAVWAYFPGNGTLRVTLRGQGEGTLRVILSDTSGLTDTQTIRVVASAPASAAPSAGAPFPWWLLLLAGIGGAGIVVARRQFGADAAGASRSTALATAPARSTYLVEDVFLLSFDGRLLYTRGGLAADAQDDPDVLGSMLVAVQEFVRDAFKSGSPVSRMSYGDNTVLLERGSSVILAVTVFGEPGAALKELMGEVIGRVERSFAGVIERWDGDRLKLAGLEELLAPLWLGSQKLTREDVLATTRGASVELLSAVEFFQGYVRVKVGVVNNTPELINGATIDLDYNADVLRLVRIEPATYRTAGSRVIVGSVAKGEKVTVAYYLDPQICTTSAIDGSCVFKDLAGRPHAIEMKRRKAEVVCPLFFTKEQANTALLKRLIETQLHQYDARGYTFKTGASEEELRGIFETMKSAVLAHDVQLVRTFEKRRPYAAEAWFYGRTAVKGTQMVIRVAVNESKGRSEFFVASTVLAPITGMLAELHHTLRESFADRNAGLGVQPLFDENLRAEYTDRAAVSRMVEEE